MTRARNFTRRRGNRDPARNANDDERVWCRFEVWKCRLSSSRVTTSSSKDCFFQVIPIANLEIGSKVVPFFVEYFCFFFSFFRKETECFGYLNESLKRSRVFGI